MTTSPTRTAALALYTPPFRYEHGYIFDANGYMVAELSVMQDEDVAALIAEILTAHWGRAPAAPMPQDVGFEDARVQLVYEMLADMEPHLEGKPDSEHWEGWIARKIVSALAAAPQPPEAAPVELPEPEFYADDRGYEVSAEWLSSDDATSDYREVYTIPRYTEQQVRELLASHGIGAPS